MAFQMHVVIMRTRAVAHALLVATAALCCVFVAISMLVGERGDGDGGILAWPTRVASQNDP